MRVKQGDRILVVGASGSGKTTFAKELALRMRAQNNVPLYVLDSNQYGDFDQWPGVVDSFEPPPPTKLDRGIQVWQPPVDDADAYEEWLKQIYERRMPATILFDELSGMATGSEKSPRYPLHYAVLQKRGRGANISSISGTQELAKIPRTARNQAVHAVRFKLNDRYDTSVIDGLLGDNVGNPPERFGFYYKKLLDNPTPVYYYKDKDDFF